MALTCISKMSSMFSCSKCSKTQSIPDPCYGGLLLWSQWFWGHPYSKLILLGVLTLSLIAFGSVGLYVVAQSGTLYDTLWASVAGVGLDW